MKKIVTIFLFSIAIFASSCSDKRFKDNLIDPTSNSSLEKWSGVFQVYDDELKTKIGADLLGGTPFITTNNHSVLDLSSTNNPVEGFKCIKYTWTGEAETEFESGEEKKYTAFSFSVGKDFDTNKSVDLSPGEYNTLSFKARGSLSENTLVKIDGPKSADDDSALNNIMLQTSGTNALTSNWTQYDISVTTTVFKKMETYLTVSFIYLGVNQGNGGTLYLDDIKIIKK